MKRREFIAVVGGAVLNFSRPGYAQTDTGLPLVGFSTPASPEMSLNGPERVA